MDEATEWPRFLATRNTWKDQGLDGTSERASTCHTVYFSALHGSQAALKSRLLMTHPAGIKQFPSRLRAVAEQLWFFQAPGEANGLSSSQGSQHHW